MYLKSVYKLKKSRIWLSWGTEIFLSRNVAMRYTK